jgi:hypothetical protein
MRKEGLVEICLDTYLLHFFLFQCCPMEVSTRDEEITVARDEVPTDVIMAPAVLEHVQVDLALGLEAPTMEVSLINERIPSALLWQRIQRKVDPLVRATRDALVDAASTMA